MSHILCVCKLAGDADEKWKPDDSATDPVVNRSDELFPPPPTFLVPPPPPFLFTDDSTLYVWRLVSYTRASIHLLFVNVHCVSKKFPPSNSP